MTDEIAPEILLPALDETPTTVTGLARRLDADEAVVEAGLASLEKQGYATDWGGIWASTWKAKLALEPAFFRFWIPASLAAGCLLAALALVLVGPDNQPTWLWPGLVGVTLAALGTAVVLRARPAD